MIYTLQSFCQNIFEEHSSRIVLRLDTTGEIVTYSDAGKLVHSIEQRLYEEGIHPGDHVCSIAPLNLESILLAWACFCSGIVFVPIDHSWSPELLNYVIKDIDAKLVFTLSSIPLQIDSHVITYDEEQAGQHFVDWLHDEKCDEMPKTPERSENDSAVILYSSGSTGQPKGVVLSQGALIRSGQLIVELFEWQKDDIFLNLGDLHSMSGLRNTCIAPLIVGCSAVVSDEKDRGSALLLPEIIKRNRCTFVGVAPIVIRQLNMCVTRFDREMISSLRAVLCTGGFLDPKQVRFFLENFSIPVLNYYGLTETTGLCSGHGFSSFNPDEISIGPAVGAELQIVDEHDNPLPEGTPGLLRVKSKNIMLGYLNRKEQTSEVIKNEWYYTGDIAEKRIDGHFILRGRSRNIIKNAYTDLIYLEEVEQALERHSGISEAGIYAYTSKFDDERMVAFVVLKEALIKLNRKELVTELRLFLTKTIGTRKVPHHFFSVNKLTRSTTGKLLRHKLKELLDDHFLPWHHCRDI